MTKPPIEDRIKEVLTPLIAECRTAMYLPEYRAKITDEEVLGCIISKFLEWSGSPICRAFLYALEDANYATLEQQLEPIVGETI